MPARGRQNENQFRQDGSAFLLLREDVGEVQLAGVVPENPVVNVFGTTRFNTVPRQMAVDLWRWRTGKVKAEDLGWVMIGANR